MADMEVTLTGHMKDGFETESKAPNFHRIFLLDTVAEQEDSFPVVARKYRIIVRVESRSLYRYTLKFYRIRALYNFISP